MRTAFLLVALALATPAQAQDAPPAPPPIEALVGIDGVQPDGPPPPPADAEAITVDIARELRCPVCQGLSVADSKTETAIAMFDRINELVRLGYSEQQIDQYFIDRYGDWVLLAPRPTGLAILLYTLPFAFIAAIVLGMVAFTRRRSARVPASTSATAPSSTPDGADPYMDKVLRDLEDS